MVATIGSGCIDRHQKNETSSPIGIFRSHPLFATGWSLRIYASILVWYHASQVCMALQVALNRITIWMIPRVYRIRKRIRSSDYIIIPL